MKHLLLYVFLVSFCGVCMAAPDPSFERLLRRAETVLLVEIVSVGEHSVTFRCREKLRGQAEAEFSLVSDSWSHGPLQVGTEFLLVSQGDARFGSPQQRLGFPGLRGPEQHGWRGWMPLPITSADHQTYVEGMFSFVDGEPFTDGAQREHSKLSLPRVKRLLETFPYDAHFNDQA